MASGTHVTGLPPSPADVAAEDDRRGAPTVAADDGAGRPPTVARTPWPTRLTTRAILAMPLPGFMAFRDRVGLRAAALVTGGRVQTIRGERVRDMPGPFIIALNHLNNFEAIATPALMMLLRGGHVSFVADWTIRLYPGLSWFATRSRAIIVWRKPARWRWLDRLFRRPPSPRRTLDQAADVLAAGGVVALYPEGTRNREPVALLPGRTGIARLALATGVPVLPVGVDYVGRVEGHRAEGWPHLIVRVGDPLVFATDGTPAPDQVRDTSAAIMRALSELSGKAAHPSQAIVDAPAQGVTA
jgi:1-acyl-sn-glycerol-3-phosphate acyltransferase